MILSNEVSKEGYLGYLMRGNTDLCFLDLSCPWRVNYGFCAQGGGPPPLHVEDGQVLKSALQFALDEFAVRSRNDP